GPADAAGARVFAAVIISFRLLAGVAVTVARARAGCRARPALPTLSAPPARPTLPALPAQPALPAPPAPHDSARPRRAAAAARPATVARRPHAHLHAQPPGLEAGTCGVAPVAAGHRRRGATTDLRRERRSAGNDA